MEKLLLEKYSPIHLFQLNRFKPKDSEAVRLLPQMPSKQLAFFLRQSMEKKMTITIQLNPSEKRGPVREHTGVLRLSSKSDNLFIVENNNTLYLCPFAQIRHIRIAK
ncbi:hypothetical protein [Atopococcus tabaci]|uniref:hypothetical protein n=1 Tax=Atopococcus tabaci TaxID=269774 RepID=UPI000417BEDA|nr:hypothetical protein [Atopococcus tabaci]